MEVPEGWEESQLGEVVRVEGGTTPKRNNPEFWSGDIPWATPTDLTSLPSSRRVIDETKECITEQGRKAAGIRLLPPGSVLVTTRATIGSAAIAQVPLTTNQGFAALLPSERVDSQYLLDWVRHNKPEFERRAAGSTFREINRSEVRKTVISLPPLPEQRRIAEILGSVDQAIQGTEAVIEQTERVKKGLLQQLLTRGVGHTRFKQTEIGEIPESWEVEQLANLCDRVGVGIASATTQAVVDHGVPLLRNQNIRESGIASDDLLYVSEEFDQSNRSKRVRSGDVITVRTGYPGLSAVVPDEFDHCQTFTTLVSRPKPAMLNSDFLCMWINSGTGKKLVLRRQAGGAQQNLNAGVLRKMPVPVPPFQEQATIAQAGATVQKLLGDHRHQASSMTKVKRGLMQDLLTGTVRVN